MVHSMVLNKTEKDKGAGGTYLVSQGLHGETCLEQVELPHHDNELDP